MKIRTHFNIAKIALRKQAHWNPIQKFVFCVGSMLPDLCPSQFFHMHFMHNSADYVNKKLKKLSGSKGLLSILKYGKMAHYVSDFCCSVHADGPKSNLSIHFPYERKLNNFMNKHFELLEKSWHKNVEDYESLDELYAAYYKGEKLNVVRDLSFAISACMILSRQVAIKHAKHPHLTHLYTPLTYRVPAN